MGIFLSVLIGVTTGIAASALFWWLQAKLLRPKMIVLPALTLTRVEGKGFKNYFSCEFKIINRSRFAAADISVKANLYVPGLFPAGSNYIFYMRDLAVAWMDPGADNDFFIGPEYLLKIDDQKEYCTRLEDKLGKSLEQLDMPQLMQSCPGSYVAVFVTSNHAFSGARSFVRAKFTEKDFIVVDNRVEHVASGDRLGSQHLADGDPLGAN
jgi:hypothetical protein